MFCPRLRGTSITVDGYKHSVSYCIFALLGVQALHLQNTSVTFIERKHYIYGTQALHLQNTSVLREPLKYFSKGFIAG